MSGERVKPESKRKAVPIPEGMIDPEAIRRALETFAAEVRRRQFGPWTTKELEEFNRQRELERQRGREIRNLVLDSPI